MDSNEKRIPNPGSDEAIDLGCTCPLMDNHYGNRPDGYYTMVIGCPVHDAGRKP